jgi:hypothetical protein
MEQKHSTQHHTIAHNSNSNDDVEDPILCDLEGLLGQGLASQVLLDVGLTSETFYSGPSHCERCFWMVLF